ncbi:MAG: PAS domain-containing sensor histidine kinase [Lacibacter sp.]
MANVVQQTSDGILSTDPYLNIQSWNKGAEEMYGFKREEVIGKPLGKFLRSTLTPEVTEKLMHELNEKGFYTAEYEFYGKQEEPVHVLASVTVLRNSEAEVSGYVAVHRDISERRKLEENLQQFNRKLEIQVEEKTQELRSVFERISDAFLGIDNNGIIVYSNRKAEELFGNAGVQLLNSSVKRLFSQTDGEVETALQEAFTNREYIYLETWIPQFARWFEMHIYPSSSGLSVYLRDITIRKIAQRELNASEEKYRLFFENSMDGILLTNANGIIFSANKAACEIFGMTEEEICSGGRSKILDESDPNWPVFFEERNINGKAQGELRHFRKDGSVFPAEITSVKFSTASGEEQTNTIIRDITDRKKAQDQLQKEKDLSDSIINTLPGIFYFCDRNGKFIRWNKKYNDVTGYSNEEIARMNPLDFFEESERAYVYARIKEAFVNGISDAEASLVTKSGKRICYYFTGARIDVDGEMFALGMGIDITDRKRAEQDVNESYLQIRRLTAYLQNIREEERANIAREIHDELGQQLTVMKMDVAWMRKRLSSGDTEAVNNKLNELLDLLDGTVASVRRISTELRPSLLDDIGLIAAAEWQAEVVAKRSGLKINIHKEGENLAVQEVFATGLFRILQESLTNITRHANASQVDIHLKNRNNEFILCVEDNGRGFDVNSLTGKKTLGLLGIKERSVAMQGTFTITSAPGKGTKVEVKVPFV